MKRNPWKDGRLNIDGVCHVESLSARKHVLDGGLDPPATEMGILGVLSASETPAA